MGCGPAAPVAPPLLRALEGGWVPTAGGQRYQPTTRVLASLFLSIYTHLDRDFQRCPESIRWRGGYLAMSRCRPAQWYQ